MDYLFVIVRFLNKRFKLFFIFFQKNSFTYKLRRCVISLNRSLGHHPKGPVKERFLECKNSVFAIF